MGWKRHNWLIYGKKVWGKEVWQILEELIQNTKTTVFPVDAHVPIDSLEHLFNSKADKAAAILKTITEGEKAVVPERSTPLSAGLDLHSAKVVLITPGKVGIIPTDLGCQIPKGHYGQIATRSNFALKGAVMVGGVIDSVYHGEIKVIIINVGEEPLIIEKDQRMAQMLLIPVSLAQAQEGSTPTELTLGGDNGFGSSNITNVGAKIWI
ncbi:uncharacterized protein LOC142297234 [Anomaloglossus baeobatrachus]|uniref:uncharacterized protein LOC142297234 n=1 Tax=Anomaloglossus baeobatrachus TaxID=238106 RepID=UPI003F4FB800